MGARLASPPHATLHPLALSYDTNLTHDHIHVHIRILDHHQIEAAWTGLPRAEQERIYGELQELQKKDWKELSLDEKKAGQSGSSRASVVSLSRSVRRAIMDNNGTCSDRAVQCRADPCCCCLVVVLRCLVCLLSHPLVILAR